MSIKIPFGEFDPNQQFSSLVVIFVWFPLLLSYYFQICFLCCCLTLISETEPYPMCSFLSLCWTPLLHLWTLFWEQHWLLNWFGLKGRYFKDLNKSKMNILLLFCWGVFSSFSDLICFKLLILDDKSTSSFPNECASSWMDSAAPIIFLASMPSL